jgi:hypothetical protein
VLEGEANPTASGSRIQLSTGGELTSTQTASGPVQIAVQPWELELCDPGSSALTDQVVSLRADHGRLLVRLTRFSVQVGAQANGRPAIAEGQVVGLRAAPEDVRVMAREDI